MNNTPLTAGEIAEITARCEAATEGKWTYDGMAYIWSSECSSDGYMIAEIRGTGYLTGKCGLSNEDANKIEDDNAEFIAHTRTDLPRALATIAQQGAELDRLRESERCEPQTNAVRIRSMDDEKLADFIDSMLNENRDDWDVPGCYSCINFETHHSDPANKGTNLYECGGCDHEGSHENGLKYGVLKWLQQPPEAKGE